MKTWFVSLVLIANCSIVSAETPPAGVWNAIESFGGPIYSRWTFQPATGSFQARWNNGNQATLKLEAFDPQRIVVTRYDANGPTAGLRVRYEGLRSENGYKGDVTWYWQGRPQRGQWSIEMPPEE